MKKFLSVALVLAMVLTGVLAMVPVTVSAEAATNETAITPTDWSTKTANADGWYEINNAADWYGLAAAIKADNSFTSGKKFKLTADINLNPGWDATVAIREKDGNIYATLPQAPAVENPYPRLDSFKGTLDGNGYTVSGYYFTEAAVDDTAACYGGVFKNLDGVLKNIVFKNGLVLNTGDYYNATVVGLAHNASGATIENVFFGINVWQKSHAGTGTWVIGLLQGTVGNNVTMKNLVFGGTMGKVHSDGPGSSKYELVTGNADSANATQILYDQEYNNAQRWEHVVAAGDVYIGNPSKEVKKLACVRAKVNGDKSTINGVEVINYRAFYSIYGKCTSVEKATDEGAIIYNKPDSTAWDMTYSDELGYIVPTSVWNMLSIDSSWYNANEDEFDISNASQWRGLARLIANETTAGSVTKDKTFNLTANIDLNPGWDATFEIGEKMYDENSDGVAETSRVAVLSYPDVPPLADKNARFNYFAGTLNGNGHTVSGYYYTYAVEAGTSTQAYKHGGGIIGTLNGGTVKDVAFENGAIIATGADNKYYTCVSGFVAELMGGTIENVVVDFGVMIQSYTGGDTTATAPNRAPIVSGLIGRKSSTGTASLENVAFIGDVIKVNKQNDKIEINATSTRNCTQIMFQSIEGTVAMNNVVAAGDVYIGADYSENKKMIALDSATSTLTNTFYGKYNSVDAAKAGTNNENDNMNLAYTQKYGVVLPTSIVAMLDGSEFSVQKKASEDKTGRVDIRLLNTIDDLNAWNEVGFKVSMTYNGNTVNVDVADDNNGIVTTTAVWSSIEAAGEVVAANELGTNSGKYIYGIVIKNVPESGVIFNVSLYAKDALGVEHDLGNTLHIAVENIK